MRLERGNLAGASDSVLDGVASALQLDEAERATCSTSPALPSQSAPGSGGAKSAGVTDGIQQILDAITNAPAWVRNARHDMLAANHLARALYSPVLADPRRPANNARFIYLDPAAREFFVDWERAADDIAAMLRSEAGSNPHDKQLIELIGELSTRSETSAPGGQPTTSGSTAPAASASSTQPSASSTSTSRRWSSPPTPD